MRALLALLLAAPAIFAAGCQESIKLGTDPAPPCQGQPCGAPCITDSCPSSQPSCGLTGAAGVCDGNVTCTTSLPPCAAKLACDGKPCGASCAPMMPMTMPMTCSEHGMCAPGAPMCMPPDPCHGLACGSLCSPPCDPHTDGGCPPPPMPMACDGTGHCSPAGMVGCAGHCMGMPMCAPCMLCPPGDPMCTETPTPKKCDPSGLCMEAPMGCP